MTTFLNLISNHLSGSRAFQIALPASNGWYIFQDMSLSIAREKSANTDNIAVGRNHSTGCFNVIKVLPGLAIR